MSGTEMRRKIEAIECGDVNDRLLRVAQAVERYGEIGSEEREELKRIRRDCIGIAEKISDLLA